MRRHLASRDFSHPFTKADADSNPSAAEMEVQIRRWKRHASAGDKHRFA